MKYVFYVTDHGVTAFGESRDDINAAVSYDWKEVEKIEDYLGSLDEKASVEVILDLIDEELNFEWNAKVHPWEKGGIAKRRKERLQSDSTLLAEVNWVDVNRVSEDGRKEELMMAVTVGDSYNVSTFLQNLEAAQVFLKNVHSKAFLLSDYFDKNVRPFLKLSRNEVKKPFLMITRQSEKVFRQTFFYEGQIRLSRLVEVDDSLDTTEDIKKALLNETKLAVAYVYNQKIVPFNSPLGFVFLDGDQEMLDGVLASCQEQGLIRSTWDPKDYFVATANFRDISADGFYCGQKQLPCYSKQAVVDFLLVSRAKGFYSYPYVNKINNMLLGKNLLVAVNIGLFLFGLYYVVISGVDSWVSWEKQKLLEQKITQHQNEKVRLQKMVQLQDDAQKIKASVEFSEAILELKVNRLISFDVNALSEVFKKNQNIQLAKISWKTVNRFDSGLNQIDIEGLVFPFNETYRNPVIWVDKFVSDLGQIQGIQNVSLQKEPLNRRLNQALTINTDGGRVKALPFTVTLRLQDDQPK